MVKIIYGYIFLEKINRKVNPISFFVSQNPDILTQNNSFIDIFC